MSASFKCKASIMIAFCILLGGLNAGLANEMRESEVFFAGAVVVTQTVVVYKVISLQDLSLTIAGYLLHQTFPRADAGAGKQHKKDANRSSNYSIVSFEKRLFERMDQGTVPAVFHAVSTRILQDAALLLNTGKLQSFLALKVYLFLHVLMLITALAGSGISGWGCRLITAGAVSDMTQLRTISWDFYFYGELVNGGGIL